MKPRVVILSAFLSPFRSGAEACAEEVALRLVDDYDITIVTTRLRRDLPKRDQLQGKVPVIRVGFGFGFDKWLYPFLAPLAVRKLKPQLVHAVLETFAGLALMFCPGKKLLTLQTTNRGLLKGSIIRSADRVTAISDVLVRHAQQQGVKAERIPNGIDLAALETARNKYPKIPGRILFVGRLEAMKGVDTLLHAFAALGYGATKLRIIGSGSQHFALEALSRKLGIADRVSFAGYVSSEHIAKEYAEAPIFCALSRSEALGNVFIEAMAAGCAVVATNIGGIPEIVRDGVTGLLVAPDDPAAAAEAMQRLLADKILCQTFGSAGMEYANGCGWDAIAPQYARLYQMLL